MRGNDDWCHYRDYPDVYVFVKSVAGKSLLLVTVLNVGPLALFCGKGKSSGQGDVYYTQARCLRRVQGGKRGFVIPAREDVNLLKLLLINPVGL